MSADRTIVFEPAGLIGGEFCRGGLAVSNPGYAGIEFIDYPVMRASGILEDDLHLVALLYFNFLK